MATTTASVPDRRGELQPLQVNTRASNTMRQVVIYALLIVIGLILFMPFILAFLGTFKTNAEIIAWPPSILPRQWLFENWPKTVSTDLGGLPRPQGSSSLGVVSGLIAFFGTFLMIGQTSELKATGMPRAVGLLIAVALALIAGFGVSQYLELRFNPDDILKISLGIAVTLFMLIAVGILAMSTPDWRRAIIAMAISIAVGAVVTVAIDQLAILAGGGRFFRWFFNIAILATVRAFLMVIFCSMAAYAFARMNFRGKDLIFNFMLATMMLPGAVTLIPAYIIIAKIGWVNTAYGLVFPYLADAFGIFMLTQFLKAVPRDLEEAAFIDGASYFQIYKDVILPLARPALLTLFIIQFQGMWNDFLVPLLYLNTPDMWVMNVALSVFQQNYSEQWNLTLVGAMINAFIPLTMFFFFSRYYIEGVSYAGVKG
jgi:multiple sugar transport system permease protein